MGSKQKDKEGRRMVIKLIILNNKHITKHNPQVIENSN